MRARGGGEYPPAAVDTQSFGSWQQAADDAPSETDSSWLEMDRYELQELVGAHVDRLRQELLDQMQPHIEKLEGALEPITSIVAQGFAAIGQEIRRVHEAALKKAPLQNTNVTSMKGVYFAIVFAVLGTGAMIFCGIETIKSLLKSSEERMANTIASFWQASVELAHSEGASQENKMQIEYKGPSTAIVAVDAYQGEKPTETDYERMWREKRKDNR